MRLFACPVSTAKCLSPLLTALLTVGSGCGLIALRADDTQPLPVVHYRPETPEDSAPTAPSKAVSATLIKSVEGQYPYEGNVQVTYANGQTAVVTADGRDSKPKVSEGGGSSAG